MSNAVMNRREVIATGAAAAAVALSGVAAQAAGPKLSLRLLETSDLHVNVYPYDYYRDGGDDTFGLAKTATLIKQARAEAKNAILFDNGDIIQGSPMGDYMAYKKGLKGNVHPIIAAMNGMDYAGCTLGNHEFNYGLEYLDLALHGAKFPATCANVFKADGSPLVKPWLVIERDVVDEAGGAHKLRIGVIGFLPPQIMQWDKDHLAGKAMTTDVVEAARRFLPELKAQKVDVVVALCHGGIARSAPEKGEENAARGLATVAGIDAIFLGHQHLVFPGKDFAGIDGVDAEKGTINGVPAVMPGFWGSHVGVIDLTLEQDNGAWKVTGHKVEARSIYDRTPDRKIVSKADADPAILAAVKADHEETLAYVRAPVGESSAPINSYFALVADDPSVQIVSQAQTWYVEQIAGTMPELKGVAVLSAAAPFKAGGRSGPDYYTDVKAGPIAIKDVADLYLYPNTVRAVKIDGATVREWLERSAGMFNQIDPAKTTEQELINPAFPSYNYDVIDGVTYKIDLTKPSRYDGNGKLIAPDAHRIVDLRYKGQPIDEKQAFIVATNNYRAGGGGNFPGCDGKTIVIEAPDTNRDVLVRYIVEQKVINPSADANWNFVPWPETANVTFVSGPAAAKAAMPKGVKVTPAGDAPDGFAKYKLAV